MLIGSAFRRALNTPGQESVERIVGDQHTVEELHDAREHQEEEKRVDIFETVSCLFIVRFPEVLYGIRRC